MTTTIVLPKTISEERKHGPKINISGDGPKCIVTVAVNRQRQVGLAMIDLAAPYELILSDIADSHNFVDSISLIKLYNVSVISRFFHHLRTLLSFLAGGDFGLGLETTVSVDQGTTTRHTSCSLTKTDKRNSNTCFRNRSHVLFLLRDIISSTLLHSLPGFPMT